MKTKDKIYLASALLIGLTVVQFFVTLPNGWQRLGLSNTLMHNLIVTLIAVNVSWLGALVISRLMNRLERSRWNKPNRLSALTNISKLSWFVLIALVYLPSIGINISSILAVGGLAGLAVGLAAKDFIGNIFGGIMIYWDKPFLEGEWIRSSDRNIEGTVKKIGLRLTEITTFEKRPLYVPNAVFQNVIIENPGRMENRRIAEAFSVRYSDNDQVEKIINEIEGMLYDHEGIDTQQTIMVHLVGLGDSSLDCQLYCFTKSTDIKVFRSIRQQILIQVIGIVRRHGADIPFPTRTLELSEMSPLLSAQQDSEQ